MLLVIERTLIVVKPEDVTANFPDPVTFTVKAKSDPDTTLTYTWYHYDEQSECEEKWCKVFNVANKTHIGDNNNGSSLMILDTNAKDLGRYRCVASNGVSEDTFEMELHAPPDFGL